MSSAGSHAPVAAPATTTGVTGKHVFTAIPGTNILYCESCGAKEGTFKYQQPCTNPEAAAAAAHALQAAAAAALAAASEATAAKAAKAAVAEFVAANRGQLRHTV